MAAAAPAPAVVAAPAEGENDGLNRHGMCKGYYFVPDDLQLFDLLDRKLRGDRQLPKGFYKVFHEVEILNFHPSQLYDSYKNDEEDGFIYFLSKRKYAKDTSKKKDAKDTSKKLPVRVVKKEGSWKASGGGKTVKSNNVGGVDVGKKLTMVFYQHRKGIGRKPVKTTWGMHEFTRIIGPDKKVADLAVYRLYKIRRKSNNENTNQGIAVGAPAAAPSMGVTPALAAPSMGVAPELAALTMGVAPALAAPSMGVAPELAAPSMGVAPALAAPTMGVAPELAGPSMGVAPELAGPTMGVAPALAAPSMGVAPELAGPSMGVAPALATQSMDMLTMAPAVSDGMMLMDQANMASISQSHAYALSRSSSMQMDWDQYSCGGEAGPGPGSWGPPSFEPEPIIWPSSPDAAAGPSSLFDDLLTVPIAVGLTSSPVLPLTATDSQLLPALQGIEDCYFGDEDLQGFLLTADTAGHSMAVDDRRGTPQGSPAAELGGLGAVPEVDEESLRLIADGDFTLQFGDGSLINFNEFCRKEDATEAALMEVEDDGGSGDAADGGGGGSDQPEAAGQN